jgi:hypothetical protein
MSGDATLSNTGALTLATVPISKGGTGLTSFASDKLVTTSGAGAVQTSSCGVNQVISFTAGGAITCANVSSLVSAFVSGGNSFGAAASLGTNDAYDLTLKTNNAARMTLSSAGKVGIGTAAPRSALDVSGAITGKAALSVASTTVDFASNNLAYTTQDCQTYALWNMKDGGTYTFAIQGTNSTLCVFNAFSDSGSTGLSVKLPPDHTTTTPSKQTVYSMMVLGTTVYVSWVPGY